MSPRPKRGLDLPVAALLLTVAFCLAVKVGPQLEARLMAHDVSDDPLVNWLGESSRMFANSFFVKADVYFHSGYYPTIFDNQIAFHTPHVALFSGTVDSAKYEREAKQNQPILNLVKPDDEDGSPGVGNNWVEKFSRNFYPVRHTHLDQGGVDGHGAEEVREILPWLRLTVELNPHQVDAYVVAAYWLRRAPMNAVKEAEEFLREGLRANPDSCEIIFELGRIQLESHHNPDRARNLWEAALKKWESLEANLPDPDKHIYSQILGQLAKMEEEQGNFTRALEVLKKLEPVSPSADSIHEWALKVSGKIDALQAGTFFTTSNLVSAPEIKPSSAGRREFPARGVIKRMNLTDHELTIAHEEIVGYMPAMTMPFQVKNTNDFAGLKVGDAVSFRLVALPTEDWIEQIKTNPSSNKP